MNQNVRFKVAITTLTVVFAAICLAQATAGYAAMGLKHKPKQPAGGANQVQGLNGKIGQMLFDGHWRFEVLSAPRQTDSYTMTMSTAEELPGIASVGYDSIDPVHVFTPRPGYTLFTVDCLVKNGQNKTEQLDCWDGSETALTDDQGQSYPAVGYDMLTQGAWTTKPLSPGSSQKMTVIFAVPPGTRFKDMVFTLRNNGQAQSHNLRISVGNPDRAGSAGASAQPAVAPPLAQGLNGKIGQMFFDGRWRFEVLSAPQQTDSYVLKNTSAEEVPGIASVAYDSDTRTFTPRNGDTLYTIDCLVKNGQNQPKQLDCWSASKTGLTDDQGNSYPAVGYDMLTSGAWTTKQLLPGSAERMTVIFAVPPGANLQGMVFTLKNDGQALSHDLHISLAK